MILAFFLMLGFFLVRPFSQRGTPLTNLARNSFFQFVSEIHQLGLGLNQLFGPSGFRVFHNWLSVRSVHHSVTELIGGTEHFIERRAQWLVLEDAETRRE